MHNNQENMALFFINSLKGGGAETVVLNLAEALSHKGIKSIFVTLYKTDSIKLPKYINNICLNLKTPKNSISSAKLMITIKNLLNKNVYWKKFIKTYLHTNFSLISAHLPLSHKVCMCSPFTKKAIYVMHVSQEIVPKPFRKIHGKIINRYYKNRKVSCVSNGMTNELIDKYSFDSKTTKTIYNPIKKNLISTNKKQIHTRPYILMIGRLTTQKRQDIAIKIFNLGNFKNECDLIILGEGPWRNKLQKLIVACNLQNHVFLKGFQDNTDQWLINSKMLLTTSDFEGFGMNILEALQYSVPVVSSDCHYGPSELLTGNLSKYLVKNQEIDIYIKLINNIFENKYPKINNENLKKFNIDNIIDQYLRYYSI